MQRILVVDDEPDLVKLLSFNLRIAGYDVILDTDGLAALERAQWQQPDLILLDLMLPELDAFPSARFCAGIRPRPPSRSSCSRPGIPI